MVMRWGYFLILLAGFGPLHANDLSLRGFQVAERAIQTNPTNWRVITAPFAQHPLLPYLQALALQLGWQPFEAQEIDELLRRFPDAPPVEALRQKLLTEMAQRGNWPIFMRYSRPDDRDDLFCHRLTGLFAQNQRSIAFNELAIYYSQGLSLPRPCQPALEEWSKSGALTANLQRERLVALLLAGEERDAQTLARQLPNRDPGQNWLRAWQQDEGAFPADLPRNLALEIGLRRCRSQPRSTLQNLPSLPASERFAIQRRCIVRLAQTRQADLALRALANLPPAAFDAEVGDLQIRLLLRDRNWAEIVRQAERWQSTLPDWPMGRYWHARALEQQRQPAAARRIYEPLTQKRDYYGFLAAYRTGLPVNIVDRPARPTPQARSRLQALPGFQRLQWLYRLNRESDALAEWRQLQPQLSEAEQIAAAKQFSEWGWHHFAITLAARLGQWDDLAWRFPIAHRETIFREAQRREVDPAWAFAIIRQETAFRSDARSSAGALGLMQLMPATAAQEGRTHNLPSHRAALLNPDQNIALGVAHLRRLQRQYNHPVLASAAYNAGGGRVNQWRRNQLPMDEWIEAIPFAETRGYAKRVFEYTVVYQHLLRRPIAPLATWLEWP